MAHDAFISYSSRDKPTADAVCAALEHHGVRCWIAPRDVLPGSEWGEAIVTAIHSSQVMVMVFSSQANESRHIRREVERAVSQGIAIVPFRIEDIVPSSSLEYFIGNVHWLDALSPPLEQHLNDLASKVKLLLVKVRQSSAKEPSGEHRSLGKEGIETIKSSQDTINVSRFCTECGTQNLTGLKFCTECGASLALVGKRCRQCGGQNSEAVKFCVHCGSTL